MYPNFSSHLRDPSEDRWKRKQASLHLLVPSHRGSSRIRPGQSLQLRVNPRLQCGQQRPPTASPEARVRSCHWDLNPSARLWDASILTCFLALGQTPARAFSNKNTWLVFYMACMYTLQSLWPASFQILEHMPE